MITRGRIASKREIVSVRPITRDDLPRLLKPRDNSLSQPQKLRESHHQIARLIAAGMKLKQVAALTGYAYNRVAVLAQAPAMIELVEQYRSKIDEIWEATADAYASTAMQNMLAAERQIADHIAEADEAGELLPLRELRAISSDRADRFGYGKKETRVNVNMDFAARLEAAINRSGKVIEGSVGGPIAAIPQSAPEVPSSSQPNSPVPTPFRRRA